VAAVLRRSGERREFPDDEYAVGLEEFNFASGHPPVNPPTLRHPTTGAHEVGVPFALIVGCKVIILSPIKIRAVLLYTEGDATKTWSVSRRPPIRYKIHGKPQTITFYGRYNMPKPISDVVYNNVCYEIAINVSLSIRTHDGYCFFNSLIMKKNIFETSEIYQREYPKSRC